MEESYQEDEMYYFESLGGLNEDYTLTLATNQSNIVSFESIRDALVLVHVVFDLADDTFYSIYS